MATISYNTIARAIYLAYKQTGGTKDFFTGVTRMLKEKGCYQKSREILSRLDAIMNEEEGRLLVRVWSAKELSETERREIEEALSKRYGGKQIILEEYTDKTMLGGIKIETGDEVIDLTLKNKIKKLQEHLNK